MKLDVDAIMQAAADVVPPVPPQVGQKWGKKPVHNQRVPPAPPVPPRKAGGERHVYDYKLDTRRDTWLVLLTYCDTVEKATDSLRMRYGPDRVLAVREHR